MKSIEFINYLNTSVENYIEMYSHKNFYEYYVKQSPNIIKYSNFSFTQEDNVSTINISYIFRYNFPKIVNKMLKLDSYKLDDICKTNTKEKTAILINNSKLHNIFKSKLEFHYKYEPISDNSMKIITTYYYSCNLKIIGSVIENIFKNRIKKDHEKTIDIWNDYIKINQKLIKK